MPEISVIMATYNAMPFLPEAVVSILEQTFHDLELIVVNDCSTDDSSQYLATIRDPRFRLIEFAANAGQGAARNHALQLCTGKYIAIMDADDISLPDRLEKQKRVLDENSAIGLVGTQFSYIGTGKRRGFSAPIPLKHAEIYADLLRGRHGFVHATMMCRSESAKQIGGYHVDRCGEDYDMLLRFGEVIRLANLPDVLYLYRTHMQSSNVTQLAEIRRRFMHAAECARCRLADWPEPTYDSFVKIQEARPIWSRWSDRLSVLALGNYKRALTSILSDQPIRGYMRLGFAALISPRWTWQRLSREVRACWHALTAERHARERDRKNERQEGNTNLH